MLLAKHNKAIQSLYNNDFIFNWQCVLDIYNKTTHEMCL